MSRFSTSIREATVPRFFVLGKGFATKRQAARALAKKEIACYAAIKALPAFRISGDLDDKSRPVDALGLLFDDWHSDSDTPNFSEGSEYKWWIHHRAEALLKGAEPLIRKTIEEISEDCMVDCWEVGFKIGHPWPKEDYILDLLGRKDVQP